MKTAFRKYGRKQFSIEPILRCHAEDADANESFWIIKNNTLYPNGYNLRHGSAAGEDGDALETAIVPASTGVIPFEGFADEASACADCWNDVAEIAAGLEEFNTDADDLCKDLLRQTHPDAQGGGQSRMFSANEVAAMLNSVRAALPTV